MRVLCLNTWVHALISYNILYPENLYVSNQWDLCDDFASHLNGAAYTICSRTIPGQYMLYIIITPKQFQRGIIMCVRTGYFNILHIHVQGVSQREILLYITRMCTRHRVV